MDTLVLDCGYAPVRRAPWQQAIVKVIIDRAAEIVAEYPDRYIRTPSWTIQMPSIIRLLKPVSKKRAVKFSRNNVYARDGGRCQYCGGKIGWQSFTYDHVIPRTQGGTTRWENVVVSCVPCNQKKGGRTPAQAGMKLLSIPVKPKKLFASNRAPVVFQEGMPDAWRDYLRDAAYWEAELESE